MQLKLRHIINKEILIYPGYVPTPGVKYRVFHYGLEFVVGNWSFDKANWRDIDVVNNCWARFPDPPDPSTLDPTDDNILQRDLLSIECARKLNEAQQLHHIRQNCPKPGSKLEKGSRKFGQFGGIDTTANDSMVVTKLKRDESSASDDKEGLFSNFKFWVVALWGFCGISLVLVMLVLFRGRRGKAKRSKYYRNKKKSSYSGLFDMDSRDKHLRNVDASL